MTEPRVLPLEALAVVKSRLAVFKPVKLEGLTKDWRFRRLRNKGKPGRANILSLKWIPSKQGLFVGIVVSKKVGNAVVRNRIRRRIREALRRMDLPPLEAVIIANPEAAKARYPDVFKALFVAMRKAGLK
jgi:ribonuclease P protein component